MKIRFFICMAVVMFLFTGQLTAQKVNKALQNKEKRQLLYADIIQDDEMFLEFMEAARALGKTVSETGGQEEALSEREQAVAELEFEVSENQLMLRQMVRLMKDFTARNPDFKKELEENHPEISEAIEMNH